MWDNVQVALGLGSKDIALLTGSLALIFAVLLVGISGRNRRRRWLGRFGWVTLLASVAVLGYGTIHRNPIAAQADAPPV
jgi:hypothetical protein